ncbi:type II toxin-antitoxin system HicB family antitoxin [Methanogenium marinum]|uniref:Type II toxin-antitoxin system HicB family antitoxin n=1 Tax=Methanogenium marinum TaxID=348610 RepID=A0A9Q4KV61_9EURY|nr:type II toxin-antitoxin system HicB family antitoxin [Methanogenium marinum]MDE4907986.1 type II toxin-antitoxin system HicB family antitoxin [Methanogenium marinum]
MKLDIVLEKEESGGYSAHCPALKGCHSQGMTGEEALKNMQEAIELYLEVTHDIASRQVTSRPGSILIDLAV